jgi:hypothetical protein
LVSARNTYKQAKSKHHKKCFEILTFISFPSFFQFAPWYTVSFLFVPLLGVPFISGEANPPSISHLPNQFWNGALCWVGSAPCCCLGGLNMTINNSTSGLCPTIGEGTCPTPLGPALWLLPGYTLCNFVYNALGLYITKHGSAVLRYISYALILPLATMAGASVFHEAITYYTLVGLITVIVGFGLYQKFHALASFGNDNDYQHMEGTHNGTSPLRNNGNSDYDNEGGIGGGIGGGPTGTGRVGSFDSACDGDVGYLPASNNDWFRKSLDSPSNPFLIGSPKYNQWNVEIKLKKRQVSFQERVIGLGLANNSNGGSSVQSTNTTRVRRAAQLYNKNKVAYGSGGGGGMKTTSGSVGRVRRDNSV